MQTDISQISLTNDFAVKEVTRENEPAEQGIEYCGGEFACGCGDECTPGRLQIIQQVPIHTMRGIERCLISAEELAGFNGRQELS